MNSAYTATVRQLLDIAPVVFATPHFAIKGGTALNLFLHDPRDHQAVARRHRVSIGDAQSQFVPQQHPAAALQRAEHAALIAPRIAGLQTTAGGGSRGPGGC